MPRFTDTWTPDLEKLLRKWTRQLGKRQGAHIKLSIKYSRRHYYIGIPTTMVTTAVSTGILSTFKNSDDPDTQIIDQYTRLAIGIVGLVGAMLSALQTFMEYQKLSESHKVAADSYETLYRDIDTIIQVPSTVRGDPLELITGIRERYDEIRKKSPQLVDYDLDLSYEVYKEPVKDSSNESVKDLYKNNKPNTENTENNRDGSSTTTKSIREQIDQMNEHDTSDEDKKVCIQLDIDSYKPVHSPTNRLKRDLYRPTRPKIDNNLRFELDRLDKHTVHNRAVSLQEMVNDITFSDISRHKRPDTIPINSPINNRNTNSPIDNRTVTDILKERSNIDVYFNDMPKLESIV